jgi:hypothetical protein
MAVPVSWQDSMAGARARHNGWTRCSAAVQRGQPRYQRASLGSDDLRLPESRPACGRSSERPCPAGLLRLAIAAHICCAQWDGVRAAARPLTFSISFPKRHRSTVRRINHFWLAGTGSTTRSSASSPAPTTAIDCPACYDPIAPTLPYVPLNSIRSAYTGYARRRRGGAGACELGAMRP